MYDNITVLAADDDPVSLMMLEAILRPLKPRLLQAADGQQALEMLAANPLIDLVLLDLEMPVLNGVDTLKQIKGNPQLAHLPVIIVTADHREVTRTLALGANDFISKPYNADELKLRTMNHVRGKRNQDVVNNLNKTLESEVQKKTAALENALCMAMEAELEICLRLGRAAEFRDLETGMHVRRISEMSKELALLAGLSKDEAERLRFAAPLHDVGKIGIPDRILLKPGKLDESEMEIMKLHTTIGGRILSDSKQYSALENGRIIALQHHEKWDGSGYPNRLAGDAIHIFARIVTVADVFDALASDRPYKQAFPLEKVIRVMEEGRGTFFDPRLLTLFFDNLERFVAIRNQLKDAEVTSDPLHYLLQVT